MPNSAFSRPKRTNDETKRMRPYKRMPHLESSSVQQQTDPLSVLFTKADNPTVLFFNATLPTHPKPVSFYYFFQHFTKTLTCIFLAKRNLVFFRDHSRLGLSLFLLRIYIGKEGSLHHPRLILLTPSVNRIKGITIVRQSIPHSFPYTFCKELRKTFWIILFTVIFQ